MTQFTGRSCVLMLGGWNLVFHCRTCGPKHKLGDSLAAHVRQSAELGDVLPRLRCPGCGSAPAKLEAVCVWVERFGRDPFTVDLTDLLSAGQQIAA